MRLRIATYNIHRCVGRDGVASTGRIAAVLRQINPDIAALQEVGSNGASRRNVLDPLAEALRAEAVPGPTMTDRRGPYGNAALSRVPPHHIRRLDLSLPGREPRGALDLAIRLNGRSIRIVATHLGLRPGERRYQMRRVLQLLDRGTAAVTILLGDFNEWFQWGRPLRWANRRFSPMPAPATFPSRRPVLALDRIWVQPAGRLLAMAAHSSPPAREASDHLPLVADVGI